MRTSKNRVALFLMAIFMLSLFAATPMAAQAAPVDITSKFTDPNFRAAVYERIGKTAPAPILDADVAGVERLDVSDRGIQSLAGLECFIGLEGLDCSQNQLASLPALPSGLIWLNCGFNRVVVLPALPSGLKSLSCNNNQLTSLPALPSSLSTLACGKNQLTALPKLPSNLTELDCWDNQLSALPSLPSGLIDLSCYYNRLVSLPTLPSGLAWIKCDNNQLTTLPTLPSGLRSLLCGNNQLISLPALPPDLEILSCSNNRLTSLPILPSDLYALDCYNNRITALPKLPSDLMELSCSRNRLTTLDVTGLNQLSFLNCAFNNMANISAVAGFSGNWDDDFSVFYPQSITCSSMPGLSLWAVDEADNLNARGVIPVPLQSDFQKPIRRDEFAAILVNVYVYVTSEVLGERDAPFTDIEKSPYKDEIVLASSMHLVDGTSSTTFSPAGLLTREQTAKLLFTMVNILDGMELGDGVPTFTDAAKISDWAKPYVAFCQENNIMQGSGSGKFDPKGHLTREQAMLVVERLIVQYDW